jgi:DNA-binding IclR family transcriptional regulator
MTTDARETQQVQSVARAIDLLEALTHKEEVALTELAERTELLPSTVHRLLATLVARGFVAQSPDSGNYRLGYRVLELAVHVRSLTAALRAVARPFLERLRDATGETTNLLIHEDGDIIYVERVEGVHSMRIFVPVGRRVPAHTTSAGKAIIATWTDQQVVDAYAGRELERFTDHGIATLDDLVDDLARTRRRGYAIDDQENEEGVSCVSAAVRDHTGSAIAAISVAGPTNRMRNMGYNALGELLVANAGELSEKLGHKPSSDDGPRPASLKERLTPSASPGSSAASGQPPP